MKFYDYSVKEILKKHFGENTVFEMRKPFSNTHKAADIKYILPLLWQYADKEALGFFVRADFLLDTIIEDDYIAYISRFGTTDSVYLMFMVTGGGPRFTMDISYAQKIVNKWEAKGYKTYILSECIGVEYNCNDKSKGFHLTGHDRAGKTGIYEISSVSGRPLLTFCEHRCWEHFRRKMISVFKSDNEEEYECLFEPDVAFTVDTIDGKRVTGKGITGLKKLVAGSHAKTAYKKEYGKCEIYTRTLYADGKEIDFSVSRRNLICELNIDEFAGRSFFVDEKETDYGSLMEAIPKLCGVRALDPVKMHGYAVQLSYADGTVRNYYLHMFEEREIPAVCHIDGFEFTRDIFMTARLDETESVAFGNEYRIPRHIAYYRAYRQLQVDHTERILGKGAGLSILSLYRTPHTEFKGWSIISNYWGLPEECFGPNYILLDESGNRKSDISLYSMDKNFTDSNIFEVRVEPTGKQGYIRRNDGTWVAPPVYNASDDEIEYIPNFFAMASRQVNGKETTFLITKSGCEVPLKGIINFGYGSDSLVSFNTEEWKGEQPFTGYYDINDYELTPGKWGFMDSEGNIVIEPKYVYVTAAGLDKYDHFVVARFVGDKLLWGVVDKNGKEVIPCSYPGLYSNYSIVGNAAFQQEEDGPYGLMNLDGQVIMEPLFDLIEEYHPDHRMVVADCGEEESIFGLYSLDLKKMIIKPEFEDIFCMDSIIRCEIHDPKTHSSKYRYFDYSGKELPFTNYDYITESKSKGALVVRKDGKYGLIDLDGKVIIPLVLSDINSVLFDTETTLENYKKGCYITESESLKGLSKPSGEMILPQVYSTIYLYGNYIVTSVNIDSGWNIKDSLFTLEGVPLLEGTFRHIRINKKDNTLTVETPEGLEHCVIEHTAS